MFTENLKIVLLDGCCDYDSISWRDDDVMNKIVAQLCKKNKHMFKVSELVDTVGGNQRRNSVEVYRSTIHYIDTFVQDIEGNVENREAIRNVPQTEGPARSLLLGPSVSDQILHRKAVGFPLRSEEIECEIAWTHVKHSSLQSELTGELFLESSSYSTDIVYEHVKRTIADIEKSLNGEYRIAFHISKIFVPQEGIIIS